MKLSRHGAEQYAHPQNQVKQIVGNSFHSLHGTFQIRQSLPVKLYMESYTSGTIK
jgi:hypothetical protein